MPGTYGYTGSSSVSRQSKDNQWIALRALRDGSMSFADFRLVCAMEGRVFAANVGTATTPITFGGGATITTTAPDFDLSCPPGTLVIPLGVRIYCEAFGSSAQMECMVSSGTLGAVAAATAVTPTNLRADAPYTSGCTVRRTSSGATYQTTNVTEHMHDGAQFTITKTAGSATASAGDQYLFKWMPLMEEGVPPILYSTAGISRFNVFVAGQAPTGFITVKWIELPGADLS